LFDRNVPPCGLRRAHRVSRCNRARSSPEPEHASRSVPPRAVQRSGARDHPGGLLFPLLRDEALAGCVQRLELGVGRRRAEWKAEDAGEELGLGDGAEVVAGIESAAESRGKIGQLTASDRAPQRAQALLVEPRESVGRCASRRLVKSEAEARYGPERDRRCRYCDESLHHSSLQSRVEGDRRKLFSLTLLGERAHQRGQNRRQRRVATVLCPVTESVTPLRSCQERL
jgi:hypothetical protein